MVLIASLFGGWLAEAMRLTHKRMEIVISGVAGFMLGVALLHLLPHALGEGRDVHAVMRWLMLGFLAMFFLERFFCFHHHDPADPAMPDAEHHHGCGEPHAHHHLTWLGVAVGLTVHSVIAGAALAASIDAESSPVGVRGWPGFAVFLVIVLHKPFDSMTLGTLMTAGKRPRALRYAVNGLFALAVPLGAMLYQATGSALATHAHDLTGPALAFAAGTFLCISLSDLLPELQFHQHDRMKLSTALLLGLAIAWGVSVLEHASHQHQDVHPHAEDTPHAH